VLNVRPVWNGDEWELHFVCNVELETNDQAGNEVAGIDLRIKNIATVAFPDKYVLYPGTSIKEDKDYFTRAEYDTEGENGPSETSMWARQKLTERETLLPRSNGHDHHRMCRTRRWHARGELA